SRARQTESWRSVPPSTTLRATCPASGRRTRRVLARCAAGAATTTKSTAGWPAIWRAVINRIGSPPIVRNCLGRSPPRRGPPPPAITTATRGNPAFRVMAPPSSHEDLQCVHDGGHALDLQRECRLDSQIARRHHGPLKPERRTLAQPRLDGGDRAHLPREAHF